MAFGVNASLTLDQVNSAYGAAFRQLSITFDQIVDLYNWYQQVGAAGLEAAPYSMSATDANTLGSAISDAYQLYTIFTGAAALATAKDFTTFIKQGWGFGY